MYTLKKSEAPHHAGRAGERSSHLCLLLAEHDGQKLITVVFLKPDLYGQSSYSVAAEIPYRSSHLNSFTEKKKSKTPGSVFFAQKGCGCPVPGGVQGQVRWGPGQSGLVLDMEVGGPACSRGVEAWWSLRSLPTQVILWFHKVKWLMLSHPTRKPTPLGSQPNNLLASCSLPVHLLYLFGNLSRPFYLFLCITINTEIFTTFIISCTALESNKNRVESDFLWLSGSLSSPPCFPKGETEGNGFRSPILSSYRKMSGTPQSCLW